MVGRVRFDNHKVCRSLAAFCRVRFDHCKACRRLAELWRGVLPSAKCGGL